MEKSRLLTLVLICFLPLFSAPAEADDKQKPILVAEIKSTINPGTLNYLTYAVKTAEMKKAQALVVKINTPGGLLSTTREIVSLFSQSPVPIVGYVSPAGASATSAGAFIFLATDLAVMDQGTNIGAATPVSSGGKDISGDIGKKVLNDTRAFIRGIAEKRNRNWREAENFVTSAKSLTASEALEKNITDLVVSGPSEFLEKVGQKPFFFGSENIQLNTKGVELEPVEPRIIDSLLIHVAHPQIAYMLTSFGSLGITVEILSPGLFFPGVMGAICLLLGLVALQTLPISVGFLCLLILGVALMVSEIFVAGFGALGIGGCIAFVLGSFYLFDDPTLISYRQEVLYVAIGIAGAFLFVTFLLLRGRIFPSIGSVEGKIGEAMAGFETEGPVLVEGRKWQAVTETPLNSQDEVIVVKQLSQDKIQVKKT